MLKPAPAMTNAERQRKFRKRNPGYHRRYMPERRPIEEAARRQMLENASAGRAIRNAIPAPVGDAQTAGIVMGDVSTIARLKRLEIPRAAG